MKRGKSKTMREYIEIRIEQLSEDRELARDDYDKMWYSRVIQELLWVLENDKTD